MLRTRLAALVLVTSALLAAVGCGGSAKPSSRTVTSAGQRPPAGMEAGGQAKSLTRSGLIARADLICRRVNAKRLSIKIRSTQDYARFLPSLARYERAAYAELGNLSPPVAMMNDWRQIVSDAQTLAVNTAKIGEYTASNNPRAAQATGATTTKIEERMLATAKRDGFVDCSQL